MQNAYPTYWNPKWLAGVRYDDDWSFGRGLGASVNASPDSRLRCIGLVVRRQGADRYPASLHPILWSAMRLACRIEQDRKGGAVDSARARSRRTEAMPCWYQLRDKGAVRDKRW